MLERTRDLDFFSLQGLSIQTGCDSKDLDLFTMKELVDNALDACKSSNPTLQVAFEPHNHFMTLSVADNGEGLSETDIKKITDYSRSYSSKFHYKFPTRGALGNALKCVFGIPYALASETKNKVPTPPIAIDSNERKYLINLQIRELDGKVEPEINCREVTKRMGTRISVNLCKLRKDWGHKQDYHDIMEAYSIFNPDVSFKLTTGNVLGLGFPVTVQYPSVSKGSKKFKGASSIWWYTSANFRQLVEAYIRGIRSGDRDLTLRQFIKQFRGLSSEEKVVSIVNGIRKSGLKYLSQLGGKPDLIEQLFKSMKYHCSDPNPEVLGEIGKKQLLRRIEQIYEGKPLFFKYKKIKRISKTIRYSVPYALEVAIAVFEGDTYRLKIHTGINFSPCLGNPFDGYYIEWKNKKGKLKKAVIMNELLRKSGLDFSEPVVIMVHLICPNIEYESYGKGKIDITPFKEDLGRLLTEICGFYPRFRKRKNTGSGRTSQARFLLRDELERRMRLLEEGGIPESDRTTLQGMYYKIRNQMSGEIDIERSTLTKSIKTECDLLGKTRAELGIFVAVRAELYFRGREYPVMIEKEGVCEVLEPYTSRKGVALVNSRGFVTEYANQLLGLSEKLKGNLFLLTDYDASGLLIAQKLPTIPRLGVDPHMITKLGLNKEDLEEKYKAPKKHLDPLPPNLQKEVKEKRVEIDAVLTVIGPEQLWNYLEHKMLELAPERDLTRSADLAIPVPPEISDPITTISEFVRSVGAPKLEDYRTKLGNWRKGLPDIENLEQSFQSEILDIIRKDERVIEIAKQLRKLVDKFFKNPQKVNPK